VNPCLPRPLPCSFLIERQPRSPSPRRQERAEISLQVRAAFFADAEGWLQIARPKLYRLLRRPCERRDGPWTSRVLIRPVPCRRHRPYSPSPMPSVRPPSLGHLVPHSRQQCGRPCALACLCISIRHRVAWPLSSLTMTNESRAEEFLIAMCFERETWSEVMLSDPTDPSRLACGWFRRLALSLCPAQ
jgi:hypothetical protein